MGKSHEILLHYDQAPGLLRAPPDAAALSLECHEDVWTVLVAELYYSGGARVAPMIACDWSLIQLLSVPRLLCRVRPGLHG